MRFAVAPHLKGKQATVIDLLAALPKEDFVRMRDENRRLLDLARADVERLLVEKQQFKEAAEERAASNRDRSADE